MKINIETFDKATKPSALYVVLADKEKSFGSSPSRLKTTWQPLVTQVLSAQAKKTLTRDSESFQTEQGLLLVLRIPKKKGLDRSENIRLAAGAALEAATSRSLLRLSIALNLAGAEEIRSVLEGLFYADYDFRKYKSEPAKNKANTEAVLLVKAQDVKIAKAILAETSAVFNHMKNLRDLVNEPGSALIPSLFADAARKLAKAQKISVTVRDEKQLRKEGFGGLWAVGKGSDHPPCMVTLRYQGAPRSKNHLCIVGKGITFDTGGISLKPGAGMAEMKCDMAGAATALAGICAIAELKLPVNVSAVLCLAENRPGNQAILPGDIFKAKNGKTVMVDNTDAEGRLVLSDGLFEAGTLKATHIIDIATLTGSVVRALGSSMAGLFANDRAFGANIQKLGASCGEKFWELPIEEEYRDWLDDPAADLRNVTNKSEAGSITAALFLQEFVPANTKWSHWDVAGTAFTTSPWKYFKPGATGFGLKTLVEIARDLA